jgi:hypothetical protein
MVADKIIKVITAENAKTATQIISHLNVLTHKMQITTAMLLSKDAK